MRKPEPPMSTRRFKQHGMPLIADHGRTLPALIG
jgi:hypothetical protein